MTHQNELNLWFSDLPTTDWPANATLAFTLFWKTDQRWQGDNWHVKVL